MEIYSMNANHTQHDRPVGLPPRIHDDSNGLDYVLHGDYYFPELGEQSGQEHRLIGKWGRMHLSYLKEYKTTMLNQLLLQGTINDYLAELDEQVKQRLETLVIQMQNSEGVTEQLKAQDQMEWVRRMNSIQQKAEEIIKSEMIFV